MKISLCIDLEASCDEGATMKTFGLECIEVGIIAIDEQAREIDRFQSYVKPQFVPITNYSTAVNHITQDMVKSAPLFSGMVVDYWTWVQTLPAMPSAWYSWGSYDRDQIELDCRRAGLTNPFPQHIDAKKVFQKRHLKNKPRVGLNKALELMGLEFEGQKHSAVDDAHNLARLFPYYGEAVPSSSYQTKPYQTQIQKDAEGYYVNLPDELLKKAGHKVGDLVTIERVNGALFIKAASGQQGEK